MCLGPKIVVVRFKKHIRSAPRLQQCLTSEGFPLVQMSPWVRLPPWYQTARHAVKDDHPCSSELMQNGRRCSSPKRQCRLRDTRLLNREVRGISTRHRGGSGGSPNTWRGKVIKWTSTAIDVGLRMKVFSGISKDSSPWSFRRTADIFSIVWSPRIPLVLVTGKDADLGDGLAKFGADGD